MTAVNGELRSLLQSIGDVCNAYTQMDTVVNHAFELVCFHASAGTGDQTILQMVQCSFLGYMADFVELLFGNDFRVFIQNPLIAGLIFSMQITILIGLLMQVILCKDGCQFSLSSLLKYLQMAQFSPNSLPIAQKFRVFCMGSNCLYLQEFCGIIAPESM